MRAIFTIILRLLLYRFIVWPGACANCTDSSEVLEEVVVKGYEYQQETD